LEEILSKTEKPGEITQEMGENLGNRRSARQKARSTVARVPHSPRFNIQL
jgi:hypothetical protein